MVTLLVKEKGNCRERHQGRWAVLELGGCARSSGLSRTRREKGRTSLVLAFLTDVVFFRSLKKKALLWHENSTVLSLKLLLPTVITLMMCSTLWCERSAGKKKKQ